MNNYLTTVNVGFLYKKLPNIRAMGRVARLIAGLISSIVVVNVCVAADSQDKNIQAQYARDRAVCINGTSQQPKATCLQEAEAARQAAMAGKLVSGSPNQLQQNRDRRCDAHTGTDREDCLKRMQGEGVQSGSAAQGGVLRELTVPVTPSPQPAQ